MAHFMVLFCMSFYNYGLHSSNITTDHLEAIPFRQSKAAVYEGSLLSSVMIEQTIIQAALSSIETSDGTKGKFEAWTESVESNTNMWL